MDSEEPVRTLQVDVHCSRLSWRPNGTADETDDDNLTVAW